MSIKNSKDLIAIANTLEISGDCFSFYEFAAKFLMGEKVNGRNDTASFYKTLKLLSQDNLDKNTINALGKSGKINQFVLKAWISSIEKSRNLKELDMEQLHYVMCYAARMCKIKQEGTTAKDHYKASHSGNKSYSTESKPKKAKTTYICPKCGKAVDLGRTLNGPSKEQCPNCHNKVRFNP